MPYWSIEGPQFDDGPQSEQTAPRRHPVAKAALVFGGVLAVGAIIIAVALLTGPQRAIGQLPPQFTGTASQDGAQGGATGVQGVATGAAPNAATPEQAAPSGSDSIASLFETMAGAVAAADHATYGRCFDVPRLYEEIQRQGMFPEMTPRQERQFIDGMGQGLRRSLAQHAMQLGWQRYEVRAVETITGKPNESVVYTRLWDAGGHSAKIRWWLVRDADGWRVYDSEDLDLGIRMSTALGVVASAGVLEPAPWVARAKQLTSISPLLIEGDHEAAERVLDQLADAGFPPMFEAVRKLFTATLRVRQGRFDEAEAAIERADALNPDMPVLDYLRAVTFNGQSRHAEALAAGERYTSLLGGDALTLREIGHAHRNLGSPAKAAEAFRRGLQDDPDATELIVELAEVLPVTRKDEIGVWFDRTTRPAELFEGLAIALLERDENAALESLIASMRSRLPEDANSSYYEAQLRYGQLRYEEAASLLREALPRAPLDEQEFYLEALLDALIAANKPVEAYEASSGRPASFRYIAERLLWTNDQEGLARLIETHRARRSDDRWIAYYEGEMYRLSERIDDAIEAFGRGLENARTDEQRGAYHQQLLTAYYDGGRAMEAYRSVPPTEVTAVTLGQLCAANADDETLVELLAAHQQRRPGDSIVHLWAAEIAWIRGEFAEVAATLQQHGGSIPSDTDLLLWRDDRLVRSLVRLNRPEEAMITATKLAAGGDAFYAALVHAAAGRAEQTRGAIIACLDSGYLPEALTDDPDLGPLLDDLRIAPAFEAAHVEASSFSIQ